MYVARLVASTCVQPVPKGETMGSMKRAFINIVSPDDINKQKRGGRILNKALMFLCGFVRTQS